MVEVWHDDRFVGALYPGDRADELRFVSKHLSSATLFGEHPPTLVIDLHRGAGEREGGS